MNKTSKRIIQIILTFIWTVCYSVFFGLFLGITSVTLGLRLINDLRFQLEYIFPNWIVSPIFALLLGVVALIGLVFYLAPFVIPLWLIWRSPKPRITRSD